MRPKSILQKHMHNNNINNDDDDGENDGPFIPLKLIHSIASAMPSLELHTPKHRHQPPPPNRIEKHGASVAVVMGMCVVCMMSIHYLFILYEPHRRSCVVHLCSLCVCMCVFLSLPFFFVVFFSHSLHFTSIFIFHKHCCCCCRCTMLQNTFPHGILW